MELTVKTRDAAEDVAFCLDRAVKGQKGGIPQFDSACVRLHRCFGGHYPNGGRTLEQRARRELLDGEAGPACEAYGAYLADLVGAKVKVAPVKTDQKAPEIGKPVFVPEEKPKKADAKK